MNKILPVFSLVILCGCTSFWGPDYISKWKQLDDVDSVSCHQWPLNEKDLGVNEVTFMKGASQLTLFAEIVKRNGSKASYSYKFDGSPKIDIDGVKPLSLGSGGALVRFEEASVDGLVPVVRSAGGGKSLVELKRIEDQTIYAASKPFGKEIYGGNIFSTSSGHWFIAIGEKTQIYFLAGNKTPLTVQGFHKLTLPNEPSFLSSTNQSEAAIISLKGHSAVKDGRKANFEIIRLSSKGKILSQTSLATNLKEVESWAVTSKQDSFKLAAIEGDSMAGQAVLRMFHFRWVNGSANLIREQSVSMKGVHLSKVVWVGTPRTDHLLVLKWVDEESTLGAYTWKDSENVKINHFGVFPKGTTVMDGFSFGKKFQSYVLMRERQNLRWNFKLCSIDGLKGT